MNIGIVVPYFTPYVRGNEYGLAKSLAKLGHNVTIFASTARAPREKTYASSSHFEGQKSGFDVKYLPTLIDIGDNPVIKGVKNQIKDLDVVMLQEDYPFICHMAFDAAKNENIHTILSSERTYYPENIIKRYALKLLDMTSNKKLRDGVDALTAHCTAAREFMTSELNVGHEIKVIHVGVDAELFRPVQHAEKHLTKGDFKILTVARLHRYKGLRYLIEAMKAIREKVPGAHLYILGKGSEEQNLKDLINQLKLENTVTFLTRPIPNYEMPQLYNECDVYAQPSITEPYGIAVLEAMACAKPVVGTMVGGMRDTIKDGETGFLVVPGDAGELAERIIMLGDEKIRKEKGERARKRVDEEFNWEFIASRYLELIDAIN